MSVRTEITVAPEAVNTLTLFTTEENQFTNKKATTPSVTWENGSAVLEVQGTRAELVAFFAAALELAEDLI